MFIGHWSAAFVAAAMPNAPRLGTAFVAAQLVDYGFFGLMLLDVEHMRLSPGISVMNPMDLYHMPYTHSLLGSVIWGAGFALFVYLWQRHRTAALIAGATVVAHWFLDLLVHVPDLTLWGTPPKLGLSLWNYPSIEIPLELGLTFGTFAFYLRRTRAISPRATLAAATLAIVLLAIQLFNWFGPEPAAVDASVPISALAAYTIVGLIAVWVARTRVHRSAPHPAN